VPQASRTFCRQLSIAASETITGSAASTTPFVVALEHHGAWGAVAIPESDLPDVVKQTLLSLPTTVPGARPQLIKRADPTDGGVSLLMAGVEPSVQRCVRWVLSDVAEVATIDWAAAAEALRRAESPPGSEPVTEPQLLVCTNGRRDRCCAKWGLPLFRELAARHRDTWETTHLGGHRFAATMLWLPTGICYGRVRLAEAETVLADVRAGRISRLEILRGRIAASAAEQFAEAAWRERRGVLEVDAVSALHSEPVDETTTLVRLVDAAGQGHELCVETYPAGIDAAPSCDKDPAPVMLRRVVDG